MSSNGYYDENGYLTDKPYNDILNLLDSDVAEPFKKIGDPRKYILSNAINLQIAKHLSILSKSMANIIKKCEKTNNNANNSSGS